jgi:hypothetical protein
MRNNNLRNNLNYEDRNWLQANAHLLPSMKSGSSRKMRYISDKSQLERSSSSSVIAFGSKRLPSDIYVSGWFDITTTGENPLATIDGSPDYPHVQWLHYKQTAKSVPRSPNAQRP